MTPNSPIHREFLNELISIRIAEQRAELSRILQSHLAGMRIGESLDKWSAQSFIKEIEESFDGSDEWSWI